MSRVIVTAAVIFAAAALVLHRAVVNGPLVEPALLLTMGSFFLLAAKICSVPRRAPREDEEKAPMLVPERSRASA